MTTPLISALWDPVADGDTVFAHLEEMAGASGQPIFLPELRLLFLRQSYFELAEEVSQSSAKLPEHVRKAHNLSALDAANVVFVSLGDDPNESGIVVPEFIVRNNSSLAWEPTKSAPA